VFSTDETLVRRVEQVTNLGFDGDRKATTQFGLNTKMSELHAATALAALDRLDAALKRRRSRRVLAAAGLCHPQDGHEHATWQFVPLTFETAAQRDEFRDQQRHCIEMRTYYEPLHRMSAFAPDHDVDLPVTEQLASTLLCLPMSDDLTDGEVSVIEQALRAHVS
jgi:dTDP-4-amino-4,6-dideoxygalactose transaminase